MKRMWTAIILLAATASMAAAAEGSKTKLLSVQVVSGTADLATALPPVDYAAAFSHSEYGYKAEYWNMMGPEYAFTISGGVGLFSEEDKPSSNLPAGSPSMKYTQNSWNVRVGGDRMLSVGEKSYIFFGPGIEYWSGKAKFENIFTVPSYETENVSRISLSGRVGGHMMVGPTWGVTAQVGAKVGRASYKASGAETTWWPSSTDGSLGLVFKFGK